MGLLRLLRRPQDPRRSPPAGRGSTQPRRRDEFRPPGSPWGETLPRQLLVAVAIALLAGILVKIILAHLLAWTR
ncbi:MAG: hypothetical protein H7831_10570 [Magnetococcus sp. WYHC-3]